MRIWSVALAVVDGPSRGARAQVGSEIARIGTADGNDLVLADRTVSRFHCEVSVRGNTIVIRDCGSTNGTLIDGVRVREAEIPPGTLVRIGGSAFRVELGEEPAFVEVSGRPAFGELVGSSVEMRRVYAILERLALTDATVLVQGETGTGKDVLARSLHAASRRADRPFVAVDCGAIPEHLVESELFGHVKGAFTGATSDRRGVFEEADGGTLFLDEIGEMPLALQPKLLRAIESRSIRRVGGTGARTVDVRIIAATNRALASSINDGSFREDLYYRLAVVEVRLPPLRARRDDIPVLAAHFFRTFGGVAGGVAGDGALPAEFVAGLVGRGWPGNVRELRNYIERSVSLGTIAPRPAAPAPAAVAAGPLPPDSIERFVALHLPLKQARRAWTESFELIYVRAMLKLVGGNVTRAAERAGVSRRFLQRMLGRLGIRAGDAGDRSDRDDE
ncbi:MAG TPA: sigma 54-interacting transcriptional regulator [Kofleriaceae bacterium]|jgi:transcriptional regulator with GAF, ATPase, and Fis domain|nr:sigma 54-interacting transcriptional regulator [Kofleriaceae bacterium]